MIRRNQAFLNLVNMASDALLIFFSYSLAMFLRMEVMGGESNLPLTSWPYQLVAAGCGLAAVLVYYILGMYSSYRLKSKPEEIFKVLLVNGVLALAVMAYFYLRRITDFPRLAVVFFWFFSSLLVAAKRSAGWAVLRYYRSLGYNQKHVAGFGERALGKAVPPGYTAESPAGDYR